MQLAKNRWTMSCINAKVNMASRALHEVFEGAAVRFCPAAGNSVKEGISKDWVSRAKALQPKYLLLVLRLASRAPISQLSSAQMCLL